MGKCKYCQGEYDYIPGIGVCIGCKNAMSSSSSNSYDSRKEAEAERAKDRAMDWYQYTDQFGNKVRVSRTTERFEVKRPFWGWMSAFKGNIERRYPNGDLYIGGVDGSLYHGKGKKFWKESGNSYEGDWVYDHRTGKGKFTWADGSYYEGDFVDSKFNGYGVRVYSTGGRYEGQFKDGMCHGKGKMIWPKGDTYEGDWFKDFQTGKGKSVWPSGAYYVGDYLKGKFHGNGFYSYTDGYTYKGQFKDGMRHGKGVLTAPDGTAVEYYYENDKIVCKAAEATDEIITRIYGSTPPKATAKPKVEKKSSGSTGVTKKVASAPAVEKVTESDADIWNKLLGMTKTEKDAHFAQNPVLVVPKGTKKIPAACFEKCMNLKEVRFNAELRIIEQSAFASCENIGPELIIPEKVETISPYAFSGCTSIKTLHLPDYISVESKAFFACHIQDIRFQSDRPHGVALKAGSFSLCGDYMSKETKKKVKDLGSYALKN